LLIPHYGVLGAAIATASGMIVQNLLRQLALWQWGGGISFFEKRHAPFFMVLGSSASGLYIIQLVTPNNIYIALTLALGVGLFVLLIQKNHLRITDTFPEIARVPVVGRILA
jgi:O-antigen/teichoic acid export membrane protein